MKNRFCFLFPSYRSIRKLEILGLDTSIAITRLDEPFVVAMRQLYFDGRECHVLGHFNSGRRILDDDDVGRGTRGIRPIKRHLGFADRRVLGGREQERVVRRAGARYGGCSQSWSRA